MLPVAAEEVMPSGEPIWRLAPESRQNYPSRPLCPRPTLLRAAAVDFEVGAGIGVEVSVTALVTVNCPPGCNDHLVHGHVGRTVTVLVLRIVITLLAAGWGRRRRSECPRRIHSSVPGGEDIPIAFRAIDNRPPRD